MDVFKLDSGYYYRLFNGMLRFSFMKDRDNEYSSIYLSLGIWKPEVTISFGWKDKI